MTSNSTVDIDDAIREGEPKSQPELAMPRSLAPLGFIMATFHYHPSTTLGKFIPSPTCSQPCVSQRGSQRAASDFSRCSRCSSLSARAPSTCTLFLLLELSRSSATVFELSVSASIGELVQAPLVSAYNEAPNVTPYIVTALALLMAPIALGEC